MKKNVLVFPCGSEIGLEINRSLAHSTHFNLYGASSVDDHGRFVYKNYVGGLAETNSPHFVEELNRMIELFNIDFIIPAHDSAVLQMAEEQTRINAEVITSSAETCRICRSKGKTYTLFTGLLATPEVFSSKPAYFPVFVKPDIGQGSKGAYKVSSQGDLECRLKRDPSLLILEYLPGEEYTVDCFTNRTGNLLFAEGRIRSRISNGISVNSKNVKDVRFLKIAKVINQTLSFQGAWFFQVKERENGELVLMEIAPRIAGTTALNRVVGVNLALLSLYDRMGYHLNIYLNKLNVEIDRALVSRYNLNLEYDYVYIDLDDTIIVDGIVNTTVVHFIYQARNHKKKIILITKHKEDVSKTLRDFAISELLFDKVIHIKSDEKKSNYIFYKNSIFIDDSFCEREDVFQRLNIPTFSLDSIECLLNWKL